MTSDSGKNVDDGNSSKTYNIGFVVATHNEESCIDEDNIDLYIPITTKTEAKLVELSPNGDNGKFETPNGLTIKYEDSEKLISHWSLPTD